jgi:hypothetical protein
MFWRQKMYLMVQRGRSKNLTTVNDSRNRFFHNRLASTLPHHHKSRIVANAWSERNKAIVLRSSQCNLQ